MLRWFILISLFIHTIIFFHVTGYYRSHLLTRIEVTLKDISEPPRRSIPRPRLRPKPPELPQEVKKLVVKRNPIPKTINVEPVEKPSPDTLVETISQPEIPQVRGVSVSDWEPGGAVADYEMKDNYMEMIRLRIEHFKKYPHLARARYLEGLATLRFTITGEGKLKGLELIKSTHHKILDRAALGAVRNAAPFPPPPSHISGGGLTLEIAIVFELT